MRSQHPLDTRHGKKLAYLAARIRKKLKSPFDAVWRGGPYTVHGVLEARRWFDQALRLGFGSAIKREWAWRTSRGESLASLAAFADFARGDGQL